MRSSLGTAVFVLVATSFLPLGVPASAASSGVGACVEFTPRGYCVQWDVPASTGGGSAGGGGGGTTGAVSCFWVTISDDLSHDPTVWADFGLSPPPAGVTVVWQERRCTDGRDPYDFRWVVPVTAENLASLARGRLVGVLPQPVVASSPPLGTASIVGVPVFVEVANWTGVVSESECAGGLCVNVTATPTLAFSPGEEGSSAIRCAGAGSQYRPGGPSLEEQASAPGACAFAYRLRTGLAGRPEAWPGLVSVTWSLSWTASSGTSGTLPAVTLSAAVQRSVEEVQTVVVGVPSS